MDRRGRKDKGWREKGEEKTNLQRGKTLITKKELTVSSIQKTQHSTCGVEAGG